MRHIEALLARDLIFADALTCERVGTRWLARITYQGPDGEACPAHVSEVVLGVTSALSLWDAVTTLDEMLARLPAGYEVHS